MAVCCRYSGITAHRGAAPTTFPLFAMTFTLLRYTGRGDRHGWTDRSMGNQLLRFDSKEAVHAASVREDCEWATRLVWKVVSTAELGNYELI